MISATVEADSSLLLEPARELCFALDRARQRAAAQLALANVSPQAAVAFKVRTRNPDAFAVRPTHGLLRPGESALVVVSVAPRSAARLAKMPPRDLEARRSSDLFKIQSVEIAADMRLAKELLRDRTPSTDALRAFWKQVPRDLVADSTLACRFVVAAASAPNGALGASHSSFMNASHGNFMNASAGVPSARDTFMSQSTFYGTCLETNEDAQAAEQLQTEPAPEPADRRQYRSDRLSLSSLSGASDVQRPSNQDDATQSPQHQASTGMTSDLNATNLSRLSSLSSSWITAAAGSPTNSVASARSTMFDARSMTSTMLDDNDTMLSARSSISTMTAGAANVASPAPTSPSLLFSIHPNDVLKFQVKRSPKIWGASSFFIVNASQTDCLTFKVRTTNQDGYFVKPTKGLVAVTSAQKIEVQLCAPKEGYLNRSKREARDAFLIEVASVSLDQYRALEALDARKKSRELSSLWSVLPQNDRSSEMLTVDFAIAAADVDDICTPLRSYNVAAGRSQQHLSSGYAGATATGESTNGEASRRGVGPSAAKGSSQRPDQPQLAVVVASPDSLDLIDFSNPNVSFFM